MPSHMLFPSYSLLRIFSPLVTRWVLRFSVPSKMQHVRTGGLYVLEHKIIVSSLHHGIVPSIFPMKHLPLPLKELEKENWLKINVNKIKAGVRTCNFQ